MAAVDEATRRWLSSLFSGFYGEASMEPPPRVGRREWGFFLFGGRGMVRPVAFRSQRELRAFLVSRAPRHVYYSTAYYRDPRVPMAEKEWLGADLVFDLDADHLEGVEGLSYGEMLKRVKEEFLKLVEGFLLGDLGFSSDDVRAVFSGGRGYHAHIRHRSVLMLGSAERREIVDYITGRGLDFDRMLEKVPMVVSRTRWGEKISHRYLLPPPGSPGWGGRINEAVRRLGARLDTLPVRDAVALFTSVKGVGKKTAGEIVERLYSPWKDYPTALEAFIEGNRECLNSMRTEKMILAVLELARREVGVLGGETDEPVTSDVKRLIRFPGSLHGKTGFHVKPLALDDLRGFDPLRDALAFSDEPVSVWVENGGEGSGADGGGIFLGGERVALRPGEN
ncbi:MAG: DNA primase small subunit PriS, partial [Thermoplasmata archaeon]|nr:DNA primase small subunit PriS [Thermoplasmata archaeon]